MTTRINIQELNKYKNKFSEYDCLNFLPQGLEKKNTKKKEKRKM